MYQLYKAGYSKKEIGRIWNTGHTTAIKAIKKVESDKSKLASSQYEEARLEVLRMGF
jgi:transposase